MNHRISKLTNSFQRSFEQLESRALLAGDLAVGLGFDGRLAVIGDASSNSVSISEVKLRAPDSNVVTAGSTSVKLDAELLGSAANLTVSSVNGAHVQLPPGAHAEVDFPIVQSTDFRLSADSRFPVLGQINHSGTVGFNNDAIVVGNFAIGFDATRINANNSGYYVADTVGGLGVLFDIGSPQLAVGNGNLTIASSDLLVSPEFAAVLLSSNLSNADLTGADVGDASIDATVARLQQRLVQDGATSVVLDTALLSSVGLDLTGADSTAPSALPGGVGFDITTDSTFQFFAKADGSIFIPQSGVIAHTGTVTFNGGITVGDFNIGFDLARASGTTSGFYVEDTVGELGILFDIGLPDAVDYAVGNLRVGPADLLVSPEFAAVLENLLGVNGLTGADVGDAQIDAKLTNMLSFVEVRGNYLQGQTTVNDVRALAFPARDVLSIAIAAGAGRDSVSIQDISLSGDLNVDLGIGSENSALLGGLHIAGKTTLRSGFGDDTWTLLRSRLNDLTADTGSGRDRVVLLLSYLAGDATIDLGGGEDLLQVLATQVAGHATLESGPGHDSFFSRFSRFGSLRFNF